MNLAQQALDAGETGRARELLQGHLPRPGEEDLRGFEWHHLQRLGTNNWTVLQRFNDRDLSTGSFALSPDGGSFATWEAAPAAAVPGGTIKVWDTASRKQVATLRSGHVLRTGPVMAFAPGGKALAVDELVTGARWRMVLWDLPAGRPAATLPGLQVEARDGLLFSPDGKTLAARASGVWVRLLDPRTGQQQASFEGSLVTCLGFSADGKLLAVGGERLRLWDLAAKKERPNLERTANALAVAFSPDGRLMAVAAPSPMAVAAEPPVVRLFALPAGQEVSALTAPGSGRVYLAFSRDGKALTAAAGGRVVAWDVASSKELFSFQTAGRFPDVSPVGLSVDGTTVATGSETAKVLEFWRAGGEPPKVVLRGHASGVSGVAVSAKGDRVVSTSLDKGVVFWDAAGREVVVLNRRVRAFSVALSADGSLLAAGEDSAVRVWDLSAARELAVLKGHAGKVAAVAFAPDGKRLVSGGEDGTVRVWEVASGKELAALKGHRGRVHAVAFAPDGKTVASGGADKGVRLWGPGIDGEEPTGRPTGEPMARPGWGGRFLGAQGEAHTDEVSSVSFAPDGRSLVSASWDHTLRLWDLTTGRQRQVFKGHTEAVLAAAFAPDGRTIASAGKDGAVRLWDLPTGQCRAALKGHAQAVTSLAFSADGRALVSGGEDRTVRLWRSAPARP